MRHINTQKYVMCTIMSTFNPHPKVEVYDNVFDMKDFTNFIPLLQMCPLSMDFKSGVPYLTTDLSSLHPRFHECLSKSMPFKNIKTTDIEKCEAQVYTIGMFPPITEKEQYKRVLVHCINPEWNPTWGGQMFFYDTNGNIVCAVSYKPNRAILFDAELSYRCSGTHAKGPKFMYTFNTTYWKPRVNRNYVR